MTTNLTYDPERRCSVCVGDGILVEGPSCDDGRYTEYCPACQHDQAGDVDVRAWRDGTFLPGATDTQPPKEVGE